MMINIIQNTEALPAREALPHQLLILKYLQNILNFCKKYFSAKNICRNFSPQLKCSIIAYKADDLSDKLQGLVTICSSISWLLK